MSLAVRTNLDLGLAQLLSAVVETVASDPGTVTNGRVIYNSTSGTFKVGQGGVWRDFLITGTRLDQIAVPTADVSHNNTKIINLATPTTATDAATKGYVDAAIQGIKWKDSVRVASTANIASLSGLLTVDGITVSANDRVLVKDQTTQTANGIYLAASGAWTRAADADSAAELQGAAVLVQEGTTQANTVWLQNADNITLGTTNITFAQLSGGGSAYTAGNGLTLTAQDFSVNVDNSSIEINADILRVKALGIVNSMIAAGTIDLTSKVTGTLPVANGGTGQTSTAAILTAIGGVKKFSADITGNGSLTQFTVNHALATLDIQVQVWEVTTGAWVLTDITKTDTNNVRIDFASAPANAKVYRVICMA